MYTNIQSLCGDPETNTVLYVNCPSVFKNLILFIYLYLAALDPHCCTRAFSNCGKLGLRCSCVARTSHCERFSHCKAEALGCAVSVVVAHGLSYLEAHGIFPDQGSNLCPRHRKADS